MSITAANVEIRQALTVAESRRVPDRREAALWSLENELEQLHLVGHVQVPASIKALLAPCELTDHERRCVSLRRTIRALIAYILDELLEQPLPGWEGKQVAPFKYSSEDWLPVRDTVKLKSNTGVECADCPARATKKGLCQRCYMKRWRQGGP